MWDSGFLDGLCLHQWLEMFSCLQLLLCPHITCMHLSMWLNQPDQNKGEREATINAWFRKPPLYTIFLFLNDILLVEMFNLLFGVFKSFFFWALKFDG